MFDNKELFFDAEIYTIKNNEISLSEEHRHNYHELYFLLDGHARHFINNEIFDVSAGQAAFVWQGYIHTVTYDEMRGAKRLLVSFSSTFIGEEYLPMLRELGKRKYLPLLPEVSNILKQQLVALLEERKFHQKHSTLQCQNLLRQAIILLCRQPELNQKQHISENEKSIQQAAQYISTHYGQRLSLHDLAKKFSMSESHFSRTFKEYTGIGVAQYIKHTRLRAAEKMLLQTPCTVTEVAYACGFSNSNYFIYDFKKYYGITPLQYAMNARKN